MPIGPLSPDPITVVAYLLGFAIFPARKNGVVSAISSGPLGPGFAKIAAAAISQLRLSLPNQRSRSVFPRRGDPCGRPEHGSAGVRPLRKKTPCGYPVGAGPGPARRSLNGSVVHRRGGTPGRPPFPTAQLEPRLSKGAVKKGSVILPVIPLPNLTAAPASGERRSPQARCQ